MPSHKIHEDMSRLVFGSSGKRIHDAIDSGYYIYGSKHRKYPPHDFVSSVLIGWGDDGLRGVGIACLHLLLDEVEGNARRRQHR